MADSGSPKGATYMDTPSTRTTHGADSQLDRIERKLDQLIEALAEEEPEEEVEAVTLDGQRHRLPRGAGHL